MDKNKRTNNNSSTTSGASQPTTRGRYVREDPTDCDDPLDDYEIPIVEFNRSQASSFNDHDGNHSTYVDTSCHSIPYRSISTTVTWIDEPV